MAKIGDLSFGRETITGYLEIQQAGKPLTVDTDSRIDFHLQGAFEFDGAPYVLIYNTATNVPSGRRLSRGSEGNDLYKVSIADGAASFEHVAELPEGIDMRLQTATDAFGVLACGARSCLRAENGLFSTKFTVISMPQSTEIVEVASQHALVQRTYNDQVEEFPASNISIFSVCDVGRELGDCQPVPADQIPYNLKADGSYSVATDYETLLRFDYDRLGLANYSEPNLESRLVWSNVYFLCGLVALYDMPISEGFKAEIKDRLTREMEAIAKLGETAYPGFKVRRYSIDREPVDFLLHLARIAKTAERARHVIGDELANRIVGPIADELVHARRTIEEITPTHNQYRRYSPFWADGVNVPWNYQDAWIEAMALTGHIDERRSEIAAMAADFGQQEHLADHPTKWGYAGGIFYQGWTGGVSANTQAWDGQKISDQPAHISYRSMDALAMLEAGRRGIPVPLDEGRVAELIRTGFLYPFVNEGMSAPVKVPFAIARHYSRATLPWEFQNEVWALAYSNLN